MYALYQCFSNACDAILVSVWNQFLSFIINKWPFQCHYYSCVEGNQTSKPASVSTLNKGGINIGITRVIITIIYPIGDKLRLFHCFCILPFVFLFMYNYFLSVLKRIHSYLNWLLPYESFHFVFIDLVLNFSEPVHKRCDSSKFIFKPDIFENLESSSRVWLRDLAVTSRIAYCDILNSRITSTFVNNLIEGI